MKLKVKLINSDAKVPSKGHPSDAGYDLTVVDDGALSKDGNYIEYKTGLVVQPEPGFHTEIFPRGSVSKTSLMLANSIGLVDQNYTGELILRFKIIRPTTGLDSSPSEPFVIKTFKKGEKAAQLVIRKTEQSEIEVVDEVSQTDRGDGRFGSTDNKKVV